MTGNSVRRLTRSETAGSVEAMRADLALRQAYGLNQSLDGVEFQ